MDKPILLKKGTKISLFDKAGFIYVPEDLHDIFSDHNVEFKQSDIQITTSTKKILAHYYFKNPLPMYDGVEISAFLWEIK